MWWCVGGEAQEIHPVDPALLPAHPDNNISILPALRVARRCGQHIYPPRPTCGQGLPSPFSPPTTFLLPSPFSPPTTFLLPALLMPRLSELKAELQQVDQRLGAMAGAAKEHKR